MSEEPGEATITTDGLLDGRVHLLQPAEGYRVAIDPVLLAAAVPAGSGESVLDAGMGTGAAALCLATRVLDCAIVGIERTRPLQRLASRSVELNGMTGRIDPVLGDIAHPPPRLTAGVFDHVMTNPPFLSAATTTPPPAAGRASAHVESDLDLAGWIAACLRMLRPKGTLTLIHRADRLDDILAALSGRSGDIVVFPLWPNAGAKAAKRVIVQARKGMHGPLLLVRGLVLHYLDGSYTPAADAVLRRGEGLHLRSPSSEDEAN